MPLIAVEDEGGDEEVTGHIVLVDGESQAGPCKRKRQILTARAINPPYIASSSKLTISGRGRGW
jgi:hypothetical protein